MEGQLDTSLLTSTNDSTGTATSEDKEPSIIRKNKNGGLYQHGKAFSDEKRKMVVMKYEELLEAAGEDGKVSGSQLASAAHVSKSTAARIIREYTDKDGKISLSSTANKNVQRGIGVKVLSVDDEMALLLAYFHNPKQTLKTYNTMLAELTGTIISRSLVSQWFCSRFPDRMPVSKTSKLPTDDDFKPDDIIQIHDYNMDEAKDGQEEQSSGMANLKKQLAAMKQVLNDHEARQLQQLSHTLTIKNTDRQAASSTKSITIASLTEEIKKLKQDSKRAEDAYVDQIKYLKKDLQKLEASLQAEVQNHKAAKTRLEKLRQEMKICAKQKKVLAKTLKQQSKTKKHSADLSDCNSRNKRARVEKKEQFTNHSADLSDCNSRNKRARVEKKEQHANHSAGLSDCNNSNKRSRDEKKKQYANNSRTHQTQALADNGTEVMLSNCVGQNTHALGRNNNIAGPQQQQSLQMPTAPKDQQPAIQQQPFLQQHPTLEQPNENSTQGDASVESDEPGYENTVAINKPDKDKISLLQQQPQDQSQGWLKF